VPTPSDHPAVRRVVAAAERKGIDLEIVAFDESTHTAEQAAVAVGGELGQIVKSLVFVAPSDDGPEPIVCLVSGQNRVDVARLAAVTGEPEIRRATAREANDLVGFTIGGIPPIGFERAVRVVMDPDLGRYTTVWAAAGLPTAVFEVPPATLRTLANATVAPITEERRPADVEADASSPRDPGPGASDEAGAITGGGDGGDGGDAGGSGDETDNATGSGRLASTGA
jgi:prolyl-tRNA editing enzyme YbaK/EbsC (Cys-tRNA(Pro) deacylase)